MEQADEQMVETTFIDGRLPSKDKYRLEKKRGERRVDETAGDEVRVTVSGRIVSYVGYAVRKFNPSYDLQNAEGAEEEAAKTNEPVEQKGVRQLTFRAMGRAISTLVSVTEIVKRRVPGLQQRTEIRSVEVEDVYIPLQDGLKKITRTRIIPAISIVLSLDPLEQGIGYQPALTPEEFAAAQEKDSTVRKTNKSKGRSRGKAKKAVVDEREENEVQPTDSIDGNGDDAEAPKPRPVRGPRGRGRGRRGRMRGGRKQGLEHDANKAASQKVNGDKADGPGPSAAAVESESKPRPGRRRAGRNRNKNKASPEASGTNAEPSGSTTEPATERSDA